MQKNCFIIILLKKKKRNIWSHCYTFKENFLLFLENNCHYRIYNSCKKSFQDIFFFFKENVPYILKMKLWRKSGDTKENDREMVNDVNVSFIYIMEVFLYGVFD